MFKKNTKSTKTTKQKETLVGEGRNEFGYHKKFQLPQETKALDLVKEIYEKIKKEKDDGDRHIIIFTRKGNNATIASHASKREFTKFVMGAIDSDCVDVDVLFKFIALKVLKEDTNNLKEIVERFL